MIYTRQRPRPTSFSRKLNARNVRQSLGVRWTVADDKERRAEVKG